MVITFERSLKVLVITARYPPDHLGGYGIRIKEIMDGLFNKGHQIEILTTVNDREKRNENINFTYPVHRKLHDRSKARFFLKEVVSDITDTKYIEKKIKQYKPDVIYLGHIYNLSKAILPYLADLDIPIVLDEGGSGLIGAWTEKGRWFRFTGSYRSKYPVLNWIKPFVVEFFCMLGKGRIKRYWQWPENMSVIFNSNSNYIRTLSKSVPIDESKVIHSGIDIEKFSFNNREGFNFPLVIICPGRIEPKKGQKDALQLLAQLQKEQLASRLVIVGAKGSDSYYEELMNNITALGIEEKVKIYPMVSQDKLIDLYHQADICYFPSYWLSGFSRIPLEAMSCGCVVFSYGNEGSKEVIHHQKTGFLIEPQNINSAITIIRGLLNKPEQKNYIIRTARDDIEENYSFQGYVVNVELIIKMAAGSN